MYKQQVVFTVVRRANLVKSNGKQSRKVAKKLYLFEKMEEVKMTAKKPPSYSLQEISFGSQGSSYFLHQKHISLFCSLSNLDSRNLYKNDKGIKDSKILKVKQA